MRKVLLASLAMTFAFTAFTACDKKNGGDDDKKVYNVKATSVTGETTDVKQVKAVYTKLDDVDLSRAYLAESPGTGTVTTTTAATGEFKNGGFSLDLPKTVAATNLKQYTVADFIEGAKLTVTSFKAVFITFEGYDATKQTGLFTQRNSGKTLYAVLAYSDTDFKATEGGTGDNKNEYVYNLDIKKGWNTVYVKVEDVDATGEGEDLVEAHKKYTLQTAQLTGIGWYYTADEEEPEV